MSSSHTSEKFIWRGLYTWWVKNSLDLIAKSYGDNFSFGDNSSATVKKLYVRFSYNEGNTGIESWIDGYGQLNIQLKINMDDQVNIIENDVNAANTGFDRTLAHEFTHAVMYANIANHVMYSLPSFVIEGLAELTVGTKNSWSDYIKALAADSSQFERGLDASKIGTG